MPGLHANVARTDMPGMHPHLSHRSQAGEADINQLLWDMLLKAGVKELREVFLGCSRPVANGQACIQAEELAICSEEHLISPAALSLDALHAIYTCQASIHVKLQCHAMH